MSSLRQVTRQMFTNNQSAESQVEAPHIKKKLNLRRNLLKILKQSPNEDLKRQIIHSYLYQKVIPRGNEAYCGCNSFNEYVIAIN